MIQNYCQTLAGAGFTKGTFDNLFGPGWLILVFIGLFGSSLLMAVAYMASKFLQMPKLEAWSRFEFYQIAATAVLAIVIAGWIWGMCNWDVSMLDFGKKKFVPGSSGGWVQDSADLRYSGAPGKYIIEQCESNSNFAGGTKILTPFCASQYYLQRIKNRGDDIFQTLVILNYGLAYLTRITWESRPLGIGYTIEPLAGFQQVQNLFLVGVSGFMVSYLSILIQMRILEYFLIAMPFYFIPIGLLLRSLPPTRQFGGALVGFAIASLLFFPLILVMNDIIMYSSLEDAMSNYKANQIALYDASHELGLFVIQGVDTGAVKIHDPNAAHFYRPVSLSELKPGDELALGGNGGLTILIRQIFERGVDQERGQYKVVLETSQRDIIELYADKAGGGTGIVQALNVTTLFNPYATVSSMQSVIGMPGGKDDKRAERIGNYFTSDAPNGEKTFSAESEAFASFLLYPYQMIMLYMIAAIVLPVINFMIYIEIAKTLTKLMGMELDLTNLTRLI